MANRGKNAKLVFERNAGNTNNLIYSELGFVGVDKKVFGVGDKNYNGHTRDGSMLIQVSDSNGNCSFTKNVPCTTTNTSVSDDATLGELLHTVDLADTVYDRSQLYDKFIDIPYDNYLQVDFEMKIDAAKLDSGANYIFFLGDFVFLIGKGKFGASTGQYAIVGAVVDYWLALHIAAFPGYLLLGLIEQWAATLETLLDGQYILNENFTSIISSTSKPTLHICFTKFNGNLNLQFYAKSLGKTIGPKYVGSIMDEDGDPTISRISGGYTNMMSGKGNFIGKPFAPGDAYYDDPTNENANMQLGFVGDEGDPGVPFPESWTLSCYAWSGSGTPYISRKNYKYNVSSSSSSSSSGGSSGGSSGSNTPGGCVTGDTAIMTSLDNEFRLAKDIKKGDIIVGATEEGLKEFVVTSKYKAINLNTVYSITFRSGASLDITDNHPILTLDGYKTISGATLPKLSVGDRVVSISDVDDIVDISLIDETIDTVYNFYTEADNFIANGVVVACEDNSFDDMYTPDEDGGMTKNLRE